MPVPLALLYSMMGSIIYDIFCRLGIHRWEFGIASGRSSSLSLVRTDHWFATLRTRGCPPPGSSYFHPRVFFSPLFHFLSLFSGNHRREPSKAAGERNNTTIDHSKAEQEQKLFVRTTQERLRRQIHPPNELFNSRRHPSTGHIRKCFLRTPCHSLMDNRRAQK